jgi:hypothetical protein
MMLDITTTATADIEKALNELMSHNEKEFKGAGFSFHWLKDEGLPGHYFAYFMYHRAGAQLGMETVGKHLIVSQMRKQFKNIDPNIEIRETKNKK